MKNTITSGRPPTRFAPRRLALALAACSFVGTSFAATPTLPSGLQVMQGQASLSTVGKQLTVTNTNGAILHWNSFSIGAQSTVNFVQPSSTSQVLNRVTGNDPSQILGSLTSNGKVWLLNPNGVLFGQGAKVNVASLVTSTLNLNDQDWLAGRYLFSAAPQAPAAGITNQGEIRATSGGQVLLLASGDVRNEGVIEAQGGQIALAAGASVELVDTATPRLSVKVTAPQGQAINLGTLSAAGGRINVQAASVNQQGIVRADSLGVGPAGEIVMNANSGRLTLDAGSITSADGDQAAGGQVKLMGHQIELANGSAVSANGALGGGTVLVGGGAQGLDAGVPNSDAVYFAPGASISANATQQGDGGNIVLWSNSATRAYGSLSATGGAQGGNGGLIETSGHWLDARPSKLNVGAPKGRAGTWLLDPIDVLIDDTPGDDFVDYVGGLYSPNAEGSHIFTGNIAAALSAGTNVTVTTTTAASSSDQGDITGQGTITVTVANPGSLTLTADHAINYSGSIVSTTGPLALSLLSGKGGQGGIVLNGATFQTHGGAILLGGYQNNGLLPNGSTFSGAANGATGVGITITNSFLDAGTGALNIYGYGNSGGVDIQPTSNLKAGDLTIYGYSLAGTGVSLVGSNAGATHSVNVQGNGNNQGLYVAGAGNFYVDPTSFDGTASLTLNALGHSPGEAMLLDNTGFSGVLLRVASGASLFVSAANQAGGNPALSLIGNSGSDLMVDGMSNAGSMNFQVWGFNNSLSLSNVQMTGSASGLSLTAAGNISLTNTTINSSSGHMATSLLAGQSLGGVGAISVTGSLISTGGGDITLGGFANGVTPQGGSFGSAASSNSTDAVSVYSSTLSAGTTPSAGGNITISGTSTGGNGVYLQEGSQLTARSITINGSATGSGLGGVYIDSSSLSSPGSITIQGYSDFVSGLSVSGYTQMTASPGVSSPGSTLSLIGASGGFNYGVSVLLSEGGSLTAHNGTAMTISGANAVPPGQSPAAVVVSGPLDTNSGGLLTINTFGSNANTIEIYDTTITGSFQGVTISGANTLNISNTQITTNGLINVQADNLTLNPGTTLTSGRTSGDAIILQGTNNGPMTRFFNTAGAAALTASASPSARWIVWYGDITDGNFQVGGLNYDFTAYGATDASAWSGINGNGFVSQTAGVAVVNGSTVTRNYDATTNAQVQGSLTAHGPMSVLTGFESVGLQYADKNAGTGKAVVLDTPLPGSILDGNSKPVYGLTLQSNVTGNVLPFQITLSGGQINDKVYDGTTSASFSNPFTGNFFAGDTASLTGGVATFGDARAGLSKFVSVSGLQLTGADAANYHLQLTINTSGNITPATLVVSGLSANNKVYDATTAASIGGGASITPIGSDQVSLSAGTAQFADKNVGSNKTVFLSGFSLIGSESGNYILSLPEFLTADITPATLTLSGLVANNKVYDTSALATLSGTAGITAFGSDQVNLVTGSAQFVNKNVGNGKSVVLTGYGLSGTDAANYLLVAPASLTANITPATLTVSGLSANNKVYDATTVATLSGAGSVAALGNDQVSLSGGSAQFSDKSVGSGKTVVLSGYGLSGTDAGNYVLSAPTSLTADITPATLNISGLRANGKIYDATTAATIGGTATVAALGNDSVSVIGTLIGSFADKNVGTGKSVALSGASLGGADAGNYLLGALPDLTANITPATLSISGLTANNKVYDASTLAALSGSATVHALGSDQVNVMGTATGAFSDANVGSGKSVALSGMSLGGADAGNYTVLTPNLSANITPATLSYVADPVSKLISAAVPALTGTVTGFVGEETQSTATSGSLGFSTAATAASPAGSYAVNGAGLTAQNYQFVQAAGNATALTVEGFAPVEQAPAVVQAGNAGVNSGVAASLAATVAAPGSTTGGGLLNMLQAPGAGPASGGPTSSASAAAVAATVDAGSTSTATAQSFGPTRLSGMTMEGLTAMLAGRDRYKRALFADAAAKLQDDPSLADAKLCSTLKQAATGTCIVTEALRRESRAQQQVLAALAPEMLLNNAPTAVSITASPATSAASSKAKAAAATQQLIALPARRRVKEAALPQIERKVAVVIGVDVYQDKTIPSLGNAVSDAEAVGRLFEDKLGYETLIIPNASKADVISALNRLALVTNSKDSVVIYYAGHGDVVEATKEGYWLLSDADAKKPETWLSNADIGRLITQIDASQVALISDSCYSGSLVSDQRIRSANSGTVDPSELLAQKSVVVMSSGGNEPVFDSGKQGHSPFSWNLMNQLGQVSKWQLGGNVFARVRFAVARELPQRPQYGTFSHGGQMNGEYLFEQRQLDAGVQ